MGIDVYVTSLSSQWAEVPTATLRRIVHDVPRMRRADAGSVALRPSRRQWFDLPWSGGSAWMSWRRRGLIDAYVGAVSARVGAVPWLDRGTGPDPYGTRLDPEGLMLMRSVAMALASNTLDPPAVIAKTREPPGERDFFAMMSRYVDREQASAAGLARFPNVMLLDIANLYLPTQFEGCWLGCPHDVGSAAQLATELRELARVLEVDTAVAEWWTTAELVEDGPRRYALYSLAVLGEACALAASAGLPILVSG